MPISEIFPNFATDKASPRCCTNTGPVAPGRENVLVWGDAVAQGERAFYSPFLLESTRQVLGCRGSEPTGGRPAGSQLAAVDYLRGRSG